MPARPLLLLTLLGLLLVLPRPAAAQADDAPETVRALHALERAWLDAYDHHDVAAMDSILADDFQITYPGGRTLDRAQTLAMLKPGTPDDPADRQYTEDAVVHVYGGDAAVITGVYVWEGPGPDGAPLVRRSRYTDTYARLGGRWRVVASHLTRLAPPRPPAGD